MVEAWLHHPPPPPLVVESRSVLFRVSFRVAGIILDPRYAVGQVRIPTRGRMYLEDDGERGGAPCSATGGSEWS